MLVHGHAKTYPFTNTTLFHKLAEEKSLVPPDAFSALETTVTQKARALTSAQHLDALEDLSHSRWSDPYSASRALRSSFRQEKTVRVGSQKRAGDVLDRYALGERVTVEDMRTPRAEIRDEETKEWQGALQERARRDGKRRRVMEGPSSHKDSSVSGKLGSMTTAGSSTSTSASKPGSARATTTPRRPIVKLKSSSSRRAVSTTKSAALASLTSQILQNSTSKGDAFGGSMRTMQRSSRLSSLKSLVRRK